jgi:hypothetical protein
VVWAEENSRDAIFAAIRRRETYGTSGTRPVVRFFGGDLDPALCTAPDMVERAYQRGVPMGGELNGKSLAGVPSFLVSAVKDPGARGRAGNDLQRIQIVKGWVDAAGVSHERVFDVAGDADNGAWVDTESCATTGSGAASLCRVWQDDNFDPRQSAFYYARVLENPSCRWSTRQCIAAGVNPFTADCHERAAAETARLQEQQGARGDVYGNCCKRTEEEPFYSPVIQERAWTSPIWFQP